jgi:hypothetical protein
MARSDTRYSVYPAPKAVEVVGNSAPALNLAIECWAVQQARAMADNAKKFWNYEATDLTGKMEDMYAFKEWGVLAETLKGMRFDPEFANPGELLATAVEDSHRLDQLGARWFSMDLPPEEYSESELTDKRVAELAKNLRELDYPHAWAVIGAVHWFWEHQKEGIDIAKDPWWTLAFRRQWHRKQTDQDKAPTAADQQQARGKAKTRKS